MNVAIFDDDQTTIDSIKLICQASPVNLNVVGEATTISEARKVIAGQDPHLVFMDIEFPEGTGFELLDAQGGNPFQVVFITAHDHYAIAAIDHEAIGYIVKPIKEKEVFIAIEKAHRKWKEGGDQAWPQVLQLLKERMDHRLALPISDGYKYVNTDDLVYLKADYGYCELYMANKERMVISKKLNWFEKQLSGQTFLRVHRSYLVNKYHISEVHRKDGGFLITSLGNRIKVSRNFQI